MQRIDPGIFQVAEGAAEFLSNPITARKRKARSKRLAADKPTILVVDDHKIIADTTAEILNRFGFRAVRTYDSQTALQIAAKLNPDFSNRLLQGNEGVTPPMVKYCTLSAKEGLKASKCCQRKLYTAASYATTKGWVFPYNKTARKCAGLRF
jgi:hypothetical protein